MLGAIPLQTLGAGKLYRALRGKEDLPLPHIERPLGIREEAYTLTQPEIEQLAEQRLRAMLAGEYTPVQEAWFQRAMQPQMARLQRMGVLRSGVAGGVLGRTAGELAAQLQQQALQEALGLGGRQRGYEQWGREMELRRYGLEAELAEKERERAFQRWQLERQLQEQARQERRKRRRGFWGTIGRMVGGGILGGLSGGPAGALKGAIGGAMGQQVGG